MSSGSGMADQLSIFFASVGDGVQNCAAVQPDRSYLGLPENAGPYLRSHGRYASDVVSNVAKLNDV